MLIVNGNQKAKAEASNELYKIKGDIKVGLGSGTRLLVVTEIKKREKAWCLVKQHLNIFILLFIRRSEELRQYFAHVNADHL